MKARTQDAMLKSCIADLHRDTYQPALRQLVMRAIETDKALRDVCGKGEAVSDAEYSRRDEAAFEARTDLYAWLINKGLDRALIREMAGVL